MTDLATETIAAAQRFDNVWDKRAVDWPLTSESVVVEVGGYKGRWALQIAERYQPKLYVFEPQPWAVATCMRVLGDRARVFGCALGDKDDKCAMGEWETDGCSLLKPGDNQVFMREIGRLFASLELSHIDLMLINIEGYEYTLIPYMLGVGILPQRLMVQLHTFADPTGMQTAAIYARLDALGYHIVWTYGAVLTAWKRL